MIKGNIEKLTLENKFYRHVLQTTSESQLVLMSLEKNEYIPEETHSTTTQFIRIEHGKGVAKIGNQIYRIKDGDFLLIPSGVSHFIKNTGETLKLYSIYSPSVHKSDLITKRQPEETE